MSNAKLREELLTTKATLQFYKGMSGTYAGTIQSLNRINSGLSDRIATFNRLTRWQRLRRAWRGGL